MGRVVTRQVHATSEQAPGFVRNAAAGLTVIAMEQTGQKQKKFFSLPFRADYTPMPEKEPCVRQMKELTGKATK